MTYTEFQILPEIGPVVLEAKIGFKFLEGESVIDQKGSKLIGDIVTFYEVIEVSPTGILVQPRYEKLTQ